MPFLRKMKEKGEKKGLQKIFGCILLDFKDLFFV
jgi:hypothetical protein